MHQDVVSRHNIVHKIHLHLVANALHVDDGHRTPETQHLARYRKTHVQFPLTRCPDCAIAGAHSAWVRTLLKRPLPTHPGGYGGNFGKMSTERMPGFMVGARHRPAVPTPDDTPTTPFLSVFSHFSNRFGQPRRFCEAHRQISRGRLVALQFRHRIAARQQSGGR